MSFALAHGIKMNKRGDSIASTPAKGVSSTHQQRIINLDWDKSPDHIFDLRRKTRNQTVEKLVSSDISRFDFKNIGIFQPKLKVSQPGDAYEEEADRIAEQVSEIPLSAESVVSKGIMKDESIMGRKCAACEMQEKEERKMNINLKPSSDITNLEASDEIANEVDRTRSSTIGSSLDADTKEFMESYFGYDFGNVKIHTGTRAAQSASLVNGLAYTTGNDIIFGEGQYKPNTHKGRKLLAHELTHVIQQQAQPTVIQRESIGDFFESAWSGLASIPGDLYRGVVRTGEGLLLGGVDRAAEIGAENERAYELIRSLFSGGLDPVVEAVKIVMEHKAATLSGFLSGRITGSLIATTIARRIAIRIAESTAYKSIANRLGVSAGASATGIGIPISLLVIQGVLQRASEASRRLRIQDPELHRLLQSRNLDMAYFLIEPHMPEIMSQLQQIR